MQTLRLFFGRYVYFSIFALYLLSIYASRALPVELPTGLALGVMAAMLFIFALAVAGFVKNSRLRVGIYLALAALSGFLYAGYAQRMVSSSVLDAFNGQDVDIVGRVASFPRLSENGMSLFLDIYRIESPQLALEDKRPLGRAFVFIRGARDLPISFFYKLEASGVFDEAREPRNRGDFSMRDYLLPYGVRHELVIPAASFIEEATPTGKLSTVFFRVKQLLVNRAAAMLKPPGREIFLGLLIGDSAIYFPQELKDTFRIAGLTHLLVVSGSQVSLLFLLVSLLFLRVEHPLSFWGRSLNFLKYSAIFGVILSYAVLTGYEPSVRRAFVVIVLVLLAHYFYYEADGLNLLGQAGLILLAMHPLEAYSVSFQLTFSATLGLILAFKAFYPYVAGMRWLPRWALGILIGTGGAQVMVMPLLMRYFNQFTPLGLVSNLVAIPLASAVLLLGIAFYALWWVPAFGGFVAWLAQSSCDALYWWAKLVSSLPGSCIYLAPISSPVALGLIALVLVAFILFGWGESRIERLSALALACGALLVVSASARMYCSGLPAFRVLYASSGAVSAYVAPDRGAVMFASLPPSLDRQSSVMSTAYWALIRGGCRSVDTVVILGG
jgi:ComEC/Rec2-related protein